jgi:hypothetical protein
MRNLKSERRQHPRIEQQLPIKVAANGYDFSTSTYNVSCLGAYCKITKYVPPFTKVMVKLDLPVSTKEGKKNYDVQCSGVIVRTEDEANGDFNVAIYFNRISEEEKKKISRYVDQFLPEKTPA